MTCALIVLRMSNNDYGCSTKRSSYKLNKQYIARCLGALSIITVHIMASSV